MQDERRKHERIPTKSNTSAMITADPPPETSLIVYSSAIIDISESGLGFGYTGTDDFPERTAFSLEIIDDKMFVGNLPIKIVSDSPHDSQEDLPVRRIGVEFCELTEGQRDILKQFIVFQKEKEKEKDDSSHTEDSLSRAKSG